MADDLSTIYTDKKLQALERKLTKTYKQAQRDIKKKTEDFFAKTAERDKLMQQRLKAGKMTQDEYDNWRRNKMLYGDNWKAQQESIAKVLADTNKVATAMINAEKADVFAFAGNYTAYEFEHGFGINFGFDLYSEKSVERLLRDNPRILPKKKLDPAKDIPWNMRNVRAQVTQGLIQGESIPKIAKRMSEAVPNRNEHQMVLHARTAMTGAQNGGRMERYKEAEDLGIKFKKVWTATLDNRTRDEHRDLDGQAVNPDEPFEIDHKKIMFPGDPDADPSLIYNCRCTLTTELDDYPSSFTRRVQEDGSIIEDQSYREWEASKTNAGASDEITLPESTTTGDTYDGTSFVEKLLQKRYSPHTTGYHNVEDYWEAKKEWEGEKTKYVDDMFDYENFRTETAWGGRRGDEKIPKIEGVIAELNDEYPAIPYGSHEYGARINGLIVGDYDRAWEYLPDGMADRRLTDDAAAQVFMVYDPGSDRDCKAYIGFHRGAITESLEESIRNREKALRTGESLLSIGDSPEVVTIHEWGHVMSTHLENAMIYQDETVVDYWEWYKGLSKDEIRHGLSAYAATNRGEFEAECFAEMHMPNPRPLALKFKGYLDEVIKKGY